MVIDFDRNAKQVEAMKAIQSQKYNFILYGGAIRGGKTFWGLSALLALCSVYPGSRWCVIREDTEKIRTTTIPSFKKIQPSGRLRESPYEYTHPNGSQILFKGENYARDKDLDWMKGFEANGFLFEEINECQEQTFNKSVERAGSWNIGGGGRQPKPIVLATCNPTQGWVKDRFYDPWEKGILRDNWLYIPAKITDNAQNLDPEYVENLKTLPRYEYQVFVEGNWNVKLKTGGEFFKNFELEQHVAPFHTDPEERVHISIDSNVLPYIAVTCWQMQKKGEGWIAKQTHDIPVKDPDNTARKAGAKVGRWLKGIGYKQRVFLYGDPTTTARNNIDDEKKSFLDLFVEGLLKEGYECDKRFFTKAPGVASTGDFINAIYEGKVPGVEILVSEYCKESINDYIETKQDKDGGILKKRITDPKTKQSYEPHGHMSDTKRYFLCKVFDNEFRQFQNRFSDHTQFKIGQAQQAY
jgi:hypothetical protein